MRITQLVRSALRRSWSYIVTSLRNRDEFAPVEDDPVGEFLGRKKGGIELLEDETEELTETPAASDAPKAPEAGGQSESVGEAKARDKEIETPAQEAEGQLQPASEVVPAVGDSTGNIQADKGKKEVALVEDSEESEVKVKAIAKDELQAAEPTAQSVVAGSKPPEQKVSQDNGGVDSMLDVFRSEESELDTLSALTKDLANMSVYSLLEESKRVAAKMRSKKKEDEAPS